MKSIFIHALILPILCWAGVCGITILLLDWPKESVMTGAAVSAMMMSLAELMKKT